MKPAEKFFLRHGVRLPTSTVTLNLALEAYIKQQRELIGRKPSRGEIELMGVHYADNPKALLRKIEGER